MLHCTLHCPLHHSIYNPQSDWLIWLTLQGTLPFLSLELFAEHYTVQYCALNCRLYCLTPFKCAVNPNVHWIVSPCCKKKGIAYSFRKYTLPASSLMYWDINVQCNLHCNVNCTLHYSILYTILCTVYILHYTGYRFSSCWLSPTGK